MPFAIPEDSSLHMPDISSSEEDEEDDDLDELDEFGLSTVKQKARWFDRQARAADRLSFRLLEVGKDDEDRILRQTLHLSERDFPSNPALLKKEASEKARKSIFMMLSMAVIIIIVIVFLVVFGIQYAGPPKQPVGPYQLLERQEGMDFFSFYNFYEGKDSVGSNGYLDYVGEQRAMELGIINVTLEQDPEDVYETDSNVTAEPFVYMGSAPTPEGPRESIRLEGKRRFHRGLFIIDLRHMPAGCGVWPAFWLTDEANWPVNGEIDIVEGVNYQSVAKTALHSTKGCAMDDVPVGVRTGDWDTAIGIPDRKTGIPDMTIRSATNCFVYDPHQWLNQGCVAVDVEGGTLGEPVNQKGGAVYALEWDPINRHMRTWVFTPHIKVPENLRKAIFTAKNPDESKRVAPDPDKWPLPYGYFAIGECHTVLDGIKSVCLLSTCVILPVFHFPCQAYCTFLISISFFSFTQAKERTAPPTSLRICDWYSILPFVEVSLAIDSKWIVPRLPNNLIRVMNMLQAIPKNLKKPTGRFEASTSMNENGKRGPMYSVKL